MVTNPTDLLEQARGGDEAALGELLGPFPGYLTLPARPQIAPRPQATADADDLVQDPFREVIILRHLEDLPLVEVARRMDRSEDSVQKLWVRALVSLRKIMVGNQ